MRVSRHHFHVGLKVFFRELGGLIQNPVFLVMTLIGNAIMFGGAGLFFHFEFGANEQVKSYFDALYWSVTSVTTVGFGDVVAQTVPGRVVSMLITLTGSALWLGFVGLFTSLFIKIEVDELEREVERLRQGLEHRKGPHEPSKT